MKPSIPKGTRDFSPREMVRRNFIFDTIKNVYQKFGFQQIETPAMENLSTLEGKYGEEGDKLLFRIINSGNPFQSVKEKHANEKISDFGFRISDFAEKGLRYDLTVPFARYVVMHQNEITFPFKRYQMQPVWRADRPQKGRYREFYQCDADVIGSTSLLNEVELIQIIDEVFSKLGVGVNIKVNNRKILMTLAEKMGVPMDRFAEFTTTIDKLDRVSQLEGGLSSDSHLRDEMSKNFGISSENVKLLFRILLTPKDQDKAGANLFKYDELQKNLPDSELKNKGLEEIDFLLKLFTEVQFKTSGIIESQKAIFNLKSSTLELDVSLARGLNYYTGTIIEVKVSDKRSTFTSSICGGGRYDDLTGIFGLPNVSGVGISFGVDRIYDVMDEMKLFDELKLSGATTKILFVNFGNEEEKYCLGLLKQIRDAGINAEIFPDAAKMKKQMGYADDNKIPFVCLVGSDEMKSGQLTLKNMISGEQEKLPIDAIIAKLKSA